MITPTATDNLKLPLAHVSIPRADFSPETVAAYLELLDAAIPDLYAGKRHPAWPEGTRPAIRVSVDPNCLSIAILPRA